MSTRQLIGALNKSFAATVYQIEPIQATVFDATSQTPAIAGKLLVTQFLNTNSFGATYTNTTVLSGQYPFGTYGIVAVPATVQGNVATIVQAGPINALVTTLTSQIVPGNLLQADAYGNLCSVGGTITVGSVLAVALGTLVTATGNSGYTTSPITIPVLVGNA